MNYKQGQQSVFTIVVFVILFLLIMGAGLGKIVNDLVSISMDYGTSAGMSGIEAFLIGNLLLWIFIGFIIAVMWWSR